MMTVAPSSSSRFQPLNHDSAAFVKTAPRVVLNAGARPFSPIWTGSGSKTAENIMGKKLRSAKKFMPGCC